MAHAGLAFKAIGTAATTLAGAARALALAVTRGTRRTRCLGALTTAFALTITGRTATAGALAIAVAIAVALTATSSTATLATTTAVALGLSLIHI